LLTMPGTVQQHQQNRQQEADPKRQNELHDKR
jgi:hypothetical protein